VATKNTPSWCVTVSFLDWKGRNHDKKDDQRGERSDFCDRIQLVAAHLLLRERRLLL
jgi:hypothetical protein